MDHMSTPVDRDGVFPASEGDIWSSSSPFVGGGLRSLSAAGATESEDRTYTETGSASFLVSPFSEGLLDAPGSESETAFNSLLAELHDEAFDEALQGLIDEAAGRYLTSAESQADELWTGESWSGASAAGEVDAWMTGLANQADQLFERLERQFGDRTVDSLQEGELDTALTEALAAQGPADLGGELLFGIVRKLGSTVKNMALSGIRQLASAAVGPLVRIFRKAFPSLLCAAIPVVVKALPEGLKADAAALAHKLGITVPGAPPAAQPPAEPALAPPAAPAGDGATTGAGEALAELFDAHVAQAALADNQTAADQLLSEWEAAGGYGEYEDGGALARLDAARATLAQQLTDAAPGSVLTSELEQFIPAVLAARPLAKTVFRAYGRDKFVGMVAGILASFIQKTTGAAPSTALSRAIVDAGFKIAGLEAEAPDRPGQLGAEALVSTLEDTIRAVGHLPPESQADPLRVRAEVQEVFSEAAARHIPGEMLRSDLDVHEMEGESGVWVLMPRGLRRPRRYRKHTTIHRVHISRPAARMIILSDEGTLEQRLLDEGVSAWPAEAEVHLYEALPGTHLGHLAASEAQHEGRPLDTSEFEDLTPQTAGLLLNLPGLGRPPTGAAGGRYYRVVLPGRPATVRKHGKRVVVCLVMTGGHPVVQVHLRLGEREAHRVGELLAQRADVRLVAAFRTLILGMVERSLPWRLIRQAQRTPGVALTTEQAKALATVIGERMVTAVATQLRALGPTLAAATRDPAPGVTFTFEFGFANPAALAASRTDAPKVVVRPGWHHG